MPKTDVILYSIRLYLGTGIQDLQPGVFNVVQAEDPKLMDRWSSKANNTKVHGTVGGAVHLTGRCCNTPEEEETQEEEEKQKQEEEKQEKEEAGKRKARARTVEEVED